MNSSPPPSPALVRRRRLQLVALALAFAGPLALAFWLYYGGGALLPHARVNRGLLVDPVRTLPPVALATPAGPPTAADFLHGKWSLVIVVGAHCAAGCRERLAELKKVRVALERDGSRVRRVLLGRPGCCAADELGPPEADLVVAWLAGEAGARLVGEFPTYGAPVEDSGRVYLVDPLGNLLMTYPPGADLKDLLKDLETLLRLSHIG
jgi:cytochrome oxidase Cu insertion factor (SCO1/SenC/PrrC family)